MRPLLDGDALDDAIPLDDESDEAVDEERGAVCAACSDLLPLGVEVSYCDDCHDEVVFRGAF